MKSNHAGKADPRQRLTDVQRWNFLEQIYTNYEEVNAQQQEIAEQRRKLNDERFQGNKDNIHNLLFGGAANVEPSRFGDWDTYEVVQGVLNRFVYSRSHEGLKSNAAEEALSERVDILTSTCTEQKERIESLETSLAAVQEELAGLMSILQIKEKELKIMKTQSLVKDLKVSQLQRICDSIQGSAPIDEKAICKDLRVLMDANRSMEKENMRLRVALDVRSFTHTDQAGHSEVLTKQIKRFSFSSPSSNPERLKPKSGSIRQARGGSRRGGDAPSQQASAGTPPQSSRKVTSGDETDFVKKINMPDNGSLGSKSRKSSLNDGGELAGRNREDRASYGAKISHDVSRHLSVSSEWSEISHRRDSEFAVQTQNLSNVNVRRNYIQQQLPITHMYIRLREEREIWMRRLEAEVANTSSLLDYDASIISSPKPIPTSIEPSRPNLNLGSDFSGVAPSPRWSEYRFVSPFHNNKTSQLEDTWMNTGSQENVDFDKNVFFSGESYDNEKAGRSAKELEIDQADEFERSQLQYTESQEALPHRTCMSGTIPPQDSETTYPSHITSGISLGVKETNREMADELHEESTGGLSHEQEGDGRILTKSREQIFSQTGVTSEGVAPLGDFSARLHSSSANSVDGHKLGEMVFGDALTANSQKGEKSEFRATLYALKDVTMKLRNDQHTIRNELTELFLMLQEALTALQEENENIQHAAAGDSKGLALQIAGDVVNDMVQQTVFDRLEEHGIVLQRYPGSSSGLTDEEWTQNQLYDAIVNASREQIAAAIFKNDADQENENVEARERKKKKSKRMGEEGREESNRELDMDRDDETQRSPGRPLLHPIVSERSQDGQRRVAASLRQVNLTGEEGRIGGGERKTAGKTKLPYTHHITGGDEMRGKQKYEKTSATQSKYTPREGTEYTNSKNDVPTSGTRSTGYTHALQTMEGDALTSYYGYLDEGGNFGTWKRHGNEGVQGDESMTPGGGVGLGFGFGRERRLDGKRRQMHALMLKSSNPYGNTAFVNPFDHQSLGVFPLCSRSPAISPRQFQGNILEYLKAIRQREKPDGIENMAPVVYHYDFKGALQEVGKDVRNKIRLATLHLRGDSFEKFFSNNVLPYANTAKSLQNGKPMAAWMASVIRHLRSEEERRNRRITRLLFQRITTNLRTRSLLSGKHCRGSAIASYVTLLWNKWTDRWYKKRETIRREGRADLHRMLDIMVANMKAASRQQQRLGEQLRLEEERRRKKFTELRDPCLDPSSAHFDVAQIPNKHT